MMLCLGMEITVSVLLEQFNFYDSSFFRFWNRGGGFFQLEGKENKGSGGIEEVLGFIKKKFKNVVDKK